jgi:predicted acetyltransferase
MILRELTLNDELAFYKMLDQWEGGAGFLIAFDLLENSDFISYLKFLNDIKSGPNASSTYFAFVDNVIVGKVNIRHSVHNEAGHIGFGVVPIYRRKGFASEMLKLAISYCQSLGPIRISLVCENSNLASKKVIEKNGGILDPLNTNSNYLRYWIKI